MDDPLVSLSLYSAGRLRSGWGNWLVIMTISAMTSDDDISDDC
jgi:hypothetical protein